MDVLTVGNDWEFFKRGNANAVYQYIGSSDRYIGKLLRLRLFNQPITTLQVHHFIESKIRLHLPETLKMDLVKVNFNKDEQLNDGYGLLMPNLLPPDSKMMRKEKYFQVYESRDSVTLELKPKWLVKSGNGCRNCAHHRYKHKERPNFCTLSLLDQKSIRKTVCTMFEDKNVQDTFIGYFKSDQSVLSKLQCLQEDISLHSLVSEDQITESISFQMSLRDVTVFLTLSKQNDDITVSVMDVDPKSHSKWKKWRDTDVSLKNGNYYIDS